MSNLTLEPLLNCHSEECPTIAYPFLCIHTLAPFMTFKLHFVNEFKVTAVTTMHFFCFKKMTS